MLISGLSPQKRDSNRFNLYIDGDFVAGISVNSVSNFSLYKGREIDEEELTQVLRADLEDRFYNRAVNYLGRGIKPEKRVREYIRTLIYKKKGDWFGEDTLSRVEDIEDKTIEKLLRDGYINDSNYAQLYASSRLRQKPRSLSLLRNELLAKGVSSQIVEEVLEELEPDEKILIKEVYNKKFGASKLEKTDSKKIDYLRRRGFSWDLISTLLEE